MEMLTIGNVLFILACASFMHGVQTWVAHLVSFVSTRTTPQPVSFNGNIMPITFTYIMAFLFIW